MSFVLCGRPIVFRAGSAEILGEFKINDQNLIVELAQIDGGGEGILPTLTSLAQRYAKKRVDIEGAGQAFYLVDKIGK